MKQFTLGLDYGTNSVRSLIVDCSNGREIATSVWTFAHGTEGIVLDPKNPELARQHPQDYIDGAEHTIREVLKAATGEEGFAPDRIIGIGVDATASTPIPVDPQGLPLAFKKEFEGNPGALAWLWKDHTAYREAIEITELASREREEYLRRIGGTHSSEWYWAKLLHALRTDPALFSAAYSWIELADFIPAFLTGTSEPDKVVRGVCAAGHKGLYNESWGGYPEAGFLAKLDPALAELRERLPDKAHPADAVAGTLSAEWAQRTGLPEGVPVAVGAIDAHFGAVGSGIKPGVLVKILGTSSCDMMVAPLSEELPDIPGIAGIVPGSILPGYYGLEAGQSAVGDIFNWYVNYLSPGGPEAGSHEELTRRAEKLAPGASGLLALDWHNGNRSLLVDQRLSGTLLGMNLHTRPEEIYRALVEATAFGARIIMERFESYGQTVSEVINCGGISAKNTMVMQIYADIMNRPLKISRSGQTPALGSAIAGAVVGGAYGSFEEAVDRMTGVLDTIFTPNPESVRVYERLFALYREVHDAFGTESWEGNLYSVMKELLTIRDEALSG